MNPRFLFGPRASASSDPTTSMHVSSRAARRASSWLRSVLLLLPLAGVVACDEPEPASCIDADCDAPPAAACDEGVRTTWLPFGACEDGACAYTASTTTCAWGCEGTRCAEEPTCDAGCDPAPAPRCEGSVVVTSIAPGTCEAGACVFETRTRDCDVDGLACDAGRCAASCGGTTCAEPAPTCEGDTVVRSTFAGCDGTTCQWATAGEDCAAVGEVCEAGACVAPDPCDGARCETPPDPRCEGAFAVVFDDEGTCANGACSYTSRRENCAATPGGLCVAGACEVIDPCDTLACDVAPPATCDGDVVVSERATETCEDGACITVTSRTDCAAVGRICREGRCVITASCVGVTCASPPAPRCEGDVRLIPRPGGGICRDGTCEYPVIAEDCAAFGRFCDAGVCVDAQSCVTGCTTPPAPFCIDEFLLRDWEPAGACAGTRCAYPPITVDCALAGGRCVDGACDFSARCDGITCDAPPADFCTGRTAVRFPDDGACEDGVCRWARVEEVCPLGTDCRDGRCRSRCEGVVCDAPPAPRCEGNTRVAPSGGACSAGICAYTESRTDCGLLDGAICVQGVCVVPDFCEGRICETPPPPTCDGRVRVAFATDGTCADGACSYPESRTDCAATGAFCLDGACVPDDPCAGVTCPALPPTCDADDRIDASNGRCDAGRCVYDTARTDCTATGDRCEAGVCSGSDRCDGIDCGPIPEPVCVDRIALRYGTPRCAAGTCLTPTEVEDCAATGRFCAAGACVDANPCEGIVCASPPPPVCDGSARFTFAPTGTCDAGTCRYTRVLATDCATDGLTCRDGACVADPCADVLCDDPPPPVCDGDVSVAVVLLGACTEGVCSWPPPERLDCAALGGGCRDGVCSFDPCRDVSCSTTRPDACEGDRVLTFSSLCVDGACVEVGTPLTCDNPERAACVGGRCVDLCEPDPCEDRSFCVLPGVRAASASTCTRGSCTYTWTQVACESGETCVDGQCVVGAPCDFVTCEAPPPPTCQGPEQPRVRITYAAGVCTEPFGACLFEPILANCPAGAPLCDEGACVSVDAPEAGELRITELVVVPERGASAQWIEVRNAGERMLSLDGVSLHTPAGSSFALPTGLVLRPGEHLIAAAGPLAFVADREQPSDPLVAAPPPGPVVTWASVPGFMLAHPTGGISIRRGSTVLDALAWTSAWPFTSDRSTQLSFARGAVEDANDAGSWCLSTLRYNDELRATPLAANQTCPIDQRPPAAGELRIDELAVRPALESRATWLEVVHSGIDAVALAGSSLYVWPDADADAPSLTVPLAALTSIEPGARIVIGSAPQVGTRAVELHAPGLDLVTSGGRVGVGTNVAEARTTSVAWTSADALRFVPGRSLERGRNAADPTSSSVRSWCASAGAPMDGLRSTPGSLNRACPARSSCDPAGPACATPAASCEGSARITWSDVACVEGFCEPNASEELGTCPEGTVCLAGTCVVAGP